MSNNDTVSICMITYNHANFISEAIESVLMQKTNFKWSLIISEDCSTDNTLNICKEYSEKHKDKIILLSNTKNQGMMSNFVRTLKACNGKYIAFIEGDDYWTDPLKLQKQVDMLEKDEEIICSHHWHRYAIKKEDGYEEIEAPIINQGYLKQRIGTVKDIFENKLRIKSRTMLFRNVIDDDFFPDWIYKAAYGDVPLSMILGKYGKFGFIDEPIAVYRQTDFGVSTFGKGTYLFTYDHYLNWVVIWEYGIRFYDYDNFIEAKKTILGFYGHIISRYPLDHKIKLKLLYYSVFSSKLHFMKRIGIISELAKSFISQIFLRLKIKTHKTLFQRA